MVRILCGATGPEPMSKHGRQNLNISVLFAAKINKVKVRLWEKTKRGEKYIRQLVSAYLLIYVCMYMCEYVRKWVRFLVTQMNRSFPKNIKYVNHHLRKLFNILSNSREKKCRVIFDLILVDPNSHEVWPRHTVGGASDWTRWVTGHFVKSVKQGEQPWWVWPNVTWPAKGVLVMTFDWTCWKKERN